MANSTKWKSKLVSSSLPLEFEVAKLLVTHGFSITADYSYARDDSGVVKDFSVDLQAIAFLPFSNPNKITSQLKLLVECKQRHPNVRWLFFPDPNRPDFSPFTLGYTIRAIDEFSRKFFRPNATVEFDAQVPYCYKGIEVDELDGRVYDAELKHGISQLQYALPRLLTNTALFSFNEQPSLICPILLTTSELLVARHNLTTNSVEAANSLLDLAKPTPYVILYSDYGLDFEKHCVRECAQLEHLDPEAIEYLDAYRHEHGEYDSKLPSVVCKSLANGKRAKLISHFTQFVVCQMNSFDILIHNIKQVASEANRTLRQSRKS